MSECIFCRIVAKTIPANILAETDTAIAFTDLNPQAPTHVLVIPKKHSENAAELAQTDPDVSAALISLAAVVANSAGLAGYRLVFNTGAAAGQTVFHTHLHLIGGRDLSWPPG